MAPEPIVYNAMYSCLFLKCYLTIFIMSNCLTIILAFKQSFHLFFRGGKREGFKVSLPKEQSEQNVIYGGVLSSVCSFIKCIMRYNIDT
jgi:hypothetical protein